MTMVKRHTSGVRLRLWRALAHIPAGDRHRVDVVVQLRCLSVSLYLLYSLAPTSFSSRGTWTPHSELEAGSAQERVESDCYSAVAIS